MLSGYGDSLKPLTAIREDIQSCISHDMVLDQASPELARIRKKIGLVEAKVKDKLDKLLRHPAYKDVLQDSLVSQRGGRYVVPVKAAYKRQMEGQVLDRSTSGSTVFIEPEEVRRLQDELNLLKCDEEKVCYVIQSELTNDLAAEMKQIHSQLAIMTHCDWVFARARLAKRHNSIAPEIKAEAVIKLVEARHPLLENSAVPLTVELGTQYRGIVITGPNTGGKTVAMKTVGLLTQMALSGLHIPAEKGSVIGYVEQVLADIGDGQSISHNLSTFSSHMTNVARILESANNKTLVLLDEVGSGTDPKEGMGIAVAIMEALYQKGCLIIASTHYGEIKTFASEHVGFVNGSMGFDVQSLKPLYRLTVGKAGDSNGLLIAKRLGMPLNIIERAMAVIGAEHVLPEITEVLPVVSLKSAAVEKKLEDVSPCEKATSAHCNLEKVDLEASAKAEAERLLRLREEGELVERKLEVGDFVNVPFMKISGVVSDLANRKGEIEILYQGKRIRVLQKRVKVAIQKEDLYPGSEYDLDIVLKTWDYRKKNKLMNKGKGKGQVIEY
jgi:dsDNA-specific endonuclease/ATPase MutS2